MQEIYLIAGIFIVVLTTYDFFFTTISFTGAGPVSKRVTSLITSLLVRLYMVTRNNTFLRLSGVTNILCQVVLWLGLVWIGFFLVLMGDNDSVIHLNTHTPATAIDKLYFSGYVLSTLGIGDFVPGNPPFWKIIVSFFSFGGFIFITTAMTYIINLTTSVIHKRSLSLFINNYGKSPEEIIINGYDGKTFSRLINILHPIQQMLNRHTQNHYSHPAVHYFYGIRREESLSVNLTNLDEALTILQLYVKEEKSVKDDIRPIQESIWQFLYKVRPQFVSVTEKKPKPLPHLDRLIKAGIPVTQQPSLSVMDSALKQRRDMLTKFLNSTGRNWEDIY